MQGELKFKAKDPGRAESQARLAALAKAGSEDAKMELWEDVKRLGLRKLTQIANSSEYNRAHLKDEVDSLAWISFMKTVETFNPMKARFTTLFSVICINEILMFLRSCRRYSPSDLLSLNGILQDSRGSEPREFVDFLADPESSMGYDLVERVYSQPFLRAKLRRAVLKLKPAQRRVVEIAFGFGDGRLTQMEMAEQLGWSQSYVSRLMLQALQSLREKLGNDSELRALL